MISYPSVAGGLTIPASLCATICPLIYKKSEHRTGQISFLKIAFPYIVSQKLKQEANLCRAKQVQERAFGPSSVSGELVSFLLEFPTSTSKPACQARFLKIREDDVPEGARQTEDVSSSFLCVTGSVSCAAVQRQKHLLCYVIELHLSFLVTSNVAQNHRVRMRTAWSLLLFNTKRRSWSWPPDAPGRALSKILQHPPRLSPARGPLY